MSEKLIYKAMIDIMNKVSSIGKDRKNEAQRYNFRGIDDVYNEMHSIMAECGVFCIPNILEDRTEDRPSSKGGVLIYRVIKMSFDFIAQDGSMVTATTIGEGMDSGDKASNKAMSVAQKYALIQTFLIPTDDLKDPENDSHDLAADDKAKLKMLLTKEGINKDSFYRYLVEKKKLQNGCEIDIDLAKALLSNWSAVKVAFNNFSQDDL